MVELEPLADPAVLPLPFMVLPLDPVVPELAPMELPPPMPAAPPPAPPPAPPAPPPPPPAANASVEPSVRIEAKAIVVSFMRCPFHILRQDNERLRSIVPKTSRAHFRNRVGVRSSDAIKCGHLMWKQRSGLLAVRHRDCNRRFLMRVCLARADWRNTPLTDCETPRPVALIRCHKC